MSHADCRPLVSAIIPVYCAEATLGETLQSVAAQTWRNLEIIIVDDGSTDGSAAIAAQFCAVHAHARVVHQPNLGVAAARNRGLAEAKGTWVALIDSDDIWHPDHIESLVSKAVADPTRPAMLYAQSRYTDVKSNIVLSPAVTRPHGNMLAQLTYHNMVGNGSALLLDRQLVLALGGYDTRLRAMGCEGCEDYLLQMRMAARYPVAATLLYSVGYRQLPGGMSKNVHRMHASRLAAQRILRAEEAVAASVPARVWRWSQADSLMTLFRWQARQGHLARAAISAIRAMLIDPSGSASNVADDAARLIWRLFGGGRGQQPRYLHFLEADPYRRDICMYDAIPMHRLSSQLRRRRVLALAQEAADERRTARYEPVGSTPAPIDAMAAGAG